MDIVDQLKYAGDHVLFVPHLYHSAADEIERLRKSRNEILEEAALNAEGFGGSANDAKNYWAREISESIRELKEKV